jgi:histone-lysine N-methyltransferase SETD2
MLPCQTQGKTDFYMVSFGNSEYIDATTQGGIGRFLNHDCEPNAQVEMW